VLSDVTNPLLGPTGAAAVFGPQKGLAADDVPLVDAALARFAARVAAAGVAVDARTPGTGAAGGTGFALAAWGADLRPGAAVVADLVGLDAALAGADLVVTGEGSFDGQTAAGKVPSLVASRAAAAGVPVALVAGRIAPDADTTGYAAAVSLTELAGDAAASFADPARWLTHAGSVLAATGLVTRGGPL
jgi:glycerate kinase